MYVKKTFTKTATPHSLLNQKIIDTLKVPVFLLLLVFVLYGNTISNKYSFDDDFVTYNNPQIQKGFKAIKEIFTTRYYVNARQNYDYRPMVKLGFAIEYALFGSNPHISHFINVILYFFLCLLLYLILKKLLRSYHPWLALAATLLFLAHPVHTEVVASLKNRDELLSMMGTAAAWYLTIKYTEAKKWRFILLAVFMLVFGYFSKAGAMVFVVVIPLSLYFFTAEKTKNILKITGILLLVVFFCILIPRLLLPEIQRKIMFFENPLYYEKGLLIRLGAALSVLLFYFRLLVFPHPLLFYYGYDQISVTNPFTVWNLFSLLLCIMLLGIALFRFRRKHVLSFAILYYFITISIYSNLLNPPPGIVADRFLFSSSLSFCLALAFILPKIFKINLNEKLTKKIKTYKKPGIILLIIFLLFSVKTISRNSQWKDFKSLYTNDIKYLHNSAKAHAVYASFLYNQIPASRDYTRQKELVRLSEKHYKQALEIYSDYAVCMNNLGIIAYKFYKKKEEAVNYWKTAAIADNEYSEPLFNLAKAYEEAGVTDTAELYYLSALKLDSSNVSGYSNLAAMYFELGKTDKAIQTNHDIMSVSPESDLPYVNIGNYYLLGKDTLNAIKYWEMAIEKQPDNPELCKNLAAYFSHVKEYKKAEYYKKLSRKKY